MLPGLLLLPSAFQDFQIFSLKGTLWWRLPALFERVPSVPCVNPDLGVQGEGEPRGWQGSQFRAFWAVNNKKRVKKANYSVVTRKKAFVCVSLCKHRAGTGGVGVMEMQLRHFGLGWPRLLVLLLGDPGALGTSPPCWCPSLGQGTGARGC